MIGDRGIVDSGYWIEFGKKPSFETMHQSNSYRLDDDVLLLQHRKTQLT
jgi:hypothetical protein